MQTPARVKGFCLNHSDSVGAIVSETLFAVDADGVVWSVPERPYNPNAPFNVPGQVWVQVPAVHAHAAFCGNYAPAAQVAA